MTYNVRMRVLERLEFLTAVSIMDSELSALEMCFRNEKYWDILDTDLVYLDVLCGILLNWIFRIYYLELFNINMSMRSDVFITIE